MKERETVSLWELFLKPVGRRIALCLLMVGLGWGYFASSLYAQPDVEAITSRLVETEFSYEPERCFIRNNEEVCPYFIQYYIAWSKDTQYPGDPPCPNGCWSSFVFKTADDGYTSIVGTKYDYSGTVHIVTFAGWATHEEARQFRESVYNTHHRVFSHFTTAEGEDIILESNSGMGFLHMNEDLEDKDKEVGPYSNAFCAGDPVYLHSGQFYYQCNDLQIPGRQIDVQLGHTYYSGMSFNGPFGYGWFLNYYMRLHQLSNGNVVITSGDGRKTEYTFVSESLYDPPDGRFETLEKNPDNSWTLTQAHGEQWQMDADGKLTAIVDRNDNTISFVYDSEKQPFYGQHPYGQDPLERTLLGLDYRLTEIHADNGRVINLTYNADGLLEKIIDNGREVVFAYDPATNDLVSVTKPATDQYPNGVTKSFEYEDHQVKKVQDAKQQYFVENHYDAEGRVEEQILGEGSFFFDYSVAKQTTVTDRKGHVTIYTFNDNGNPESEEILTPTGSYLTTSIYNADMLKITETFPKDNGVKYVYDETNPDPRSQGNLLEIRRKADMLQLDDDAVDLVTRIGYASDIPPPIEFNLPQTIADPKGNVTEYKYDYEMPPEDPRYGINGNLVMITYPQVEAGIPQVDLTYNDYGQVTQVEDPNNNLTEYEYYPDTGYLQKIIQDPGGINAVTQFTYDDFGYPDVVTDANGKPTDFNFNELGWLNQVTNPLGYITKYSQDENGNVTKIERQKNVNPTEWQETVFTYTTLNHLETVTDPLSRVTTYTYDANENLKSILDAEGSITDYVYDERDLLSTITDANSPRGLTQYTYDANRNLQQILDANNNPTTYAYDGFDRLLTTTYVDDSIEELGYDKNGNVTQMKTPSTYPDLAFNYEYDALNRLEAVRNLIDSTLDKTFVYDLASRLTHADNAAALNHFTYDNLNRVDTNTQDLPSGMYLLDYDYDKVGNRTKVTYPSGKVVDYVYDDNNRMADVKVNNIRMTHYKYDLLDRRIERDYLIPQELLPANTSGGNVIEANPSQAVRGILPKQIEQYHGLIQRAIYGWDDANQLKDLTNTIVGGADISRYQYSRYDGVGNRKQMIAPDGTHDYGYDTIYQLAEEKIDAVTAHNYDYDPVGNREVADGTIYQPNNLNQYTNVGGTAFVSDGNGNLASDGTNTYTYDEENRLASVVSGQSSVYSYDAFNRRVSKTVNGEMTYFIQDGDREIEERKATGQLKATYVFGAGIDEVLTMDRGGYTFFYHYDGLGSVREVTDLAGNPIESYTYDPYGQAMIYDASHRPLAISQIANPYMFTGRRFDEESGLYHYRNRTYNPLIGRFHQRDPIGYYDSMNLYQFVVNNPLNYIDPFGLDTYRINNKFNESTPTNRFLSHSFMAITDIDPATGEEKVIKTFSWVNTGGGMWEDPYKQQNIEGAQKAIDTRVGAWKMGDESLDKYMEEVFEKKKDEKGGFYGERGTCKNQANRLLDEALKKKALKK